MRTVTPTLEIREGTHVAVLFSTPATLVDGKMMDIFGAVFRHADEDHWHMRYRFRYYEDGRVFGSDDRKSAHRMAVKGDEGDIVEKTLSVMREVASRLGVELDVVHVHSADHGVFLDAVRRVDWMHIAPTGVGGDA